MTTGPVDTGANTIGNWQWNQTDRWDLIRMEGEAIHGGWFSTPLISHVAGDLYQGGCIDGTVLGSEFDVIVSLYPWERYRIDKGVERWEFRMYDGVEVDEQTIQDAADIVNASLDSGLRVLVHCQAGLNRSGVVTAKALIDRGMHPEDAIRLLRSKRDSAVLCNKTFERWLLEQGKED